MATLVPAAPLANLAQVDPQDRAEPRETLERRVRLGLLVAAAQLARLEPLDPLERLDGREPAGVAEPAGSAAAVAHLEVPEAQEALVRRAVWATAAQQGRLE